MWIRSFTGVGALKDQVIFDHRALTLEGAGLPVRLTRKAADILACLMRRKGEIVSQQTLLHEVWPGLHVAPDLVREYVCDLRAALGDDPKAPQFIETVRGRGYRLMGPLRAADVAEAAVGGPIRVAVLDLGDPLQPDRWRRVGAEFREDLTAALAHYCGVAVIALGPPLQTGSTAPLGATARSVAASYLVTGRVGGHAGRRSLTVQMVNGASDEVCWSYRRDTSRNGSACGMLDAAHGVAASIAGRGGVLDRVERSRVRRRPPASLDARELCVRASEGLDATTRGPVLAALADAERSVALDPTFVGGWLTLNWLRYASVAFGWSKLDAHWLRRERAVFQRAVDLDPRDPLPYTYLALSYATTGSVGAACRCLARIEGATVDRAEVAVDLAIGMATVAGQPIRALALIDRARALVPDPPRHWGHIEARAAFLAGQHERALVASDIDIGRIETYLFRALACAELGENAGARAAWGDLIRLAPDFDAERYARGLPIAHPDALRLFRAGVAKVGALA